MQIKKILISIILWTLFLFQTGCLGIVAVGAGAGTVMWVKGDMEVTSEKPLEEVFKAVELTCGELKFSIIRKEQKIFKGTIVAEGDFGRLVFEIRAKSPKVTNISIRVGALGDKGASELIYNKLKPKL